MTNYLVLLNYEVRKKVKSDSLCEWRNRACEEETKNWRSMCNYDREELKDVLMSVRVHMAYERKGEEDLGSERARVSS